MMNCALLSVKYGFIYRGVEIVSSLSLASHNNWRAGASQPSRTTGTIFLYWDGAHPSCAHARKLRETPTRH